MLVLTLQSRPLSPSPAQPNSQILKQCFIEIRTGLAIRDSGIFLLREQILRSLLNNNPVSGNTIFITMKVLIGFSDTDANISQTINGQPLAAPKFYCPQLVAKPERL